MYNASDTTKNDFSVCRTLVVANEQLYFWLIGQCSQQHLIYSKQWLMQFKEKA